MISFIIITLATLGCLLIIFSQSPFFGIFGVLALALAHSSLLCLLGMSFFGLLIILIYVGGMIIVFLFSTILSAEKNPEINWKPLIITLATLSIISIPFNHLDSNPTYPTSYYPAKETTLSQVFHTYSNVTCLIGIILFLTLVTILIIGFEQTQKSLRPL